MKSERKEKAQMTKRRRIDEEREWDVKQRLTEMRNKGGSGGRGDMIIHSL